MSDFKFSIGDVVVHRASNHVMGVKRTDSIPIMWPDDDNRTTCRFFILARELHEEACGTFNLYVCRGVTARGEIAVAFIDIFEAELVKYEPAVVEKKP